MPVWRIQAKAGHGPYAHARGYPRRFPDNDRPAPEHAPRGRQFGFKSLADLVAWFDSPRRDWLKVTRL
jgi:hypothetical protein